MNFESDEDFLSSSAFPMEDELQQSCFLLFVVLLLSDCVYRVYSQWE